MKLKQALRLSPGQLVAFTGAGGKSSALQVLAAELAPAIPVVLTTTTKIGQDQFPLASQRVIDDGSQDLDSMVAMLESEGLLLWTGPPIPSEAKWSGVSPSRIDAFKQHAERLGAIVLVEADGARGRPIKAPAAHEPMIPNTTDLVVPVFGMRALGQPLHESNAHRPARIAEIGSIELGGVVTKQALIRLLTSANGGLKGIPAAAEVRALLNQVETAGQAEIQSLAEGCLAASERISAVLTANLMADNPVERVVGRTAGVVLAAGSGSRMGKLKQVREWQGVPLVQRMVQVAAEAGLDPLVVVAGSQGDRVAAAVEPTGAEIVYNRDWAAGQSGSMRLGLDHVAEGSEAVVFMLADMPLIEAKHIQLLIAAHQQSLAAVVAPYAQERFGNPVLFDRRAYPALRQVEGDQGGRAVFDQFEVQAVPADRWALVDVDTEQDWDQLIQ